MKASKQRQMGSMFQKSLASANSILDSDPFALVLKA